ncbi:phage tail protein [Pseudomonas sp. S49]|uniref:phage tail protein n=1 Tax=Pseudomonas sp. S49 TaxID=1573720 RepID=UPI00132F45FE|nr:phage tail protein [Pseudomonas sp. S49]QHF50084.1 hypothetical protein PspS49_10735 [Pseudomonas sp. S49]
MPWYKTGTVSVTQNSNAVIGTGTAFIANSRVGDGFRGPDGRWYEVTNIASNTALSISPNYEGPTAAGGFYSIMPVQGYQKDLSDKVREILNDYGETLAALGTTGNYDILPVAKGGTGAVTASDALTELGFSDFAKTLVDDADAGTARTTLLAAKSGANDDITSLTALTTAIPISMGGTGGKTQATARTGLGLGSAAIVDVVGLMSNNAIIEKGTSAAGDWVKWSDGTMICTFRYTGSLGINIAYGSVFYGDFPTLAFPQAFVSLPSIAMNVTLPGGGAWVGRQNNGSLTTTGSSIVVSPVTRGATTVTMEYIAVGRWKL